MKNSLIKKLLIIFSILILIPLVGISFFSPLLRVNLIFILFISLIFIFTFAFLFSKLITIPINRLHKGIKKVTKGDLKYRVNIHTGDEIEELGKAFNEMAGELEQYQDKTDELKTVLQIKVKARTRELEELNKTLEIKVKKRTEEFKKRLDQLEKFHRLTVGRELKMIEFKKELQKLKSKKR